MERLSKQRLSLWYCFTTRFTTGRKIARAATPSSKAEVGQHDENIDFAATCALIGDELAEQVRDISLEIYTRARNYAAERGIIIADTKFEFGLDANNIKRLLSMVLIVGYFTP